MRPRTAAPYMEVGVPFLEGGLVDREAGYCCTLHGSCSAFFKIKAVRRKSQPAQVALFLMPPSPFLLGSFFRRLGRQARRGQTAGCLRSENSKVSLKTEFVSP